MHRSPGQTLVHEIFCTVGPWQGLPRFFGEGESQWRERRCVPFPHLLVQLDHCDHVDQSPFTAIQRSLIYRNINEIFVEHWILLKLGLLWQTNENWIHQMTVPWNLPLIKANLTRCDSNMAKYNNRASPKQLLPWVCMGQTTQLLLWAFPKYV